MQIKIFCHGLTQSAHMRDTPCLTPLCSFPVELQEAGIPAKFAPTIGIAVDHRRKNRSLEGLQVWMGRNQQVTHQTGCFKPHAH